VANFCLPLLAPPCFGRIVGLALSLAACASAGPVTDPVARNLTWFSYLAGDDIRAGCGAGAPDRYRFVYNAVWGEQVRTYDIVTRPHGALQIGRVFGSANLLSFDLLDPQQPWRGQRSEVPLDAAALARVARLLPGEESAKPGTWLRSEDYYWIASACEDGRFILQAWDSDTRAFDDLPFLKVLLPADRTGVAPRPWRRLSLPPFDPARVYRGTGQGTLQVFQVQLGENRLRVGPGL
jgi:hypothetical protein